MKKVVALILAVFYLSTSIGVTVNMHYCMDKIAGWGLNNKESNICSKCGMEKSNSKDKDCCKDKHTNFKITEDQKITESTVQLAQQIVHIVPAYYNELPILYLSSVKEMGPMDDSPPLRHCLPIYILNCDFRI